MILATGYFMMNIITETERLYFREVLPTDVQAFFDLDSDPEVHLYLGNTPIKTTEQAKANIDYIRQQYVDPGIGRLAIIEKDTDKFVGWGGFKLITAYVNGHKNYHDLGYRFIRKYWGKGYATESSKAAIDYGFRQLNLPVIYAIADTANLSSKHVLEKCGFVNTGLFEYDGTPHYWFELINPAQSGY